MVIISRVATVARARMGAVTIMFLVFAAARFCAAASSPDSAEKSRYLTMWKESLQQIDRELRAQAFADAEESCESLAKELLDNLGKGTGSARTLALICAYRAIADVGLGKQDEGLWFWRSAGLLYEDIDSVDLSVYDPIAAKLKATPFRAAFAGVPFRKGSEAGTKEEPPKVRRHPRPRYPEGMVRMRVESSYGVEIVIDVDGLAKEPRMLSKVDEPCLVYAILEAVKGWRFRPARSDGKPVPCLFDLVVTFDIRK